MQYVANTGESDVTLAAATAKTVLMLKSTAALSALITEISACFTGTSATNEPVLIELVKCTLAGTGTSTEAKPVQVRGPGNEGGEGTAATITAAANYTAEPTVITRLKAWRVSPTSGLLYQAPLGREPEIPLKASPFVGLGLRMKAANEVKVTAYLEFVQGPS